MTEPTPWRAMLALARHLGLTPRSFWRLSLTEWRALVAPSRSERLTRAALDALAARFPD